MLLNNAPKKPQIELRQRFVFWAALYQLAYCFQMHFIV